MPLWALHALVCLLAATAPSASSTELPPGTYAVKVKSLVPGCGRQGAGRRWNVRPPLHFLLTCWSGRLPGNGSPPCRGAGTPHSTASNRRVVSFLYQFASRLLQTTPCIVDGLLAI